MIGALSSASCADNDEGATKKTTPPDYPKPGPGELCEWPPNPGFVKIQFQPSFTAIAPGETRVVEVIVEPDVCVATKITFESGDESIMVAPKAEELYLTKSKFKISLTAKGLGQTKLTASFPKGDGTNATAELPVEVMTPDIPACSGSGAGKLDDGKTVKGSGGLALAGIGLQAGGSKPNSGSFLWSVQPFDVTIGCAKDQVPEGFTAMGPAVTFGPIDKRLKREIPFSLPINPAVMPEGATLRHVTVSYTGPRAQTPRSIPIANPRIVRGDAGYTLEFMAPRLGTYQAVVQSDGGERKRMRKLTHRALIGISMGGGGTAMFGLRNHERFDVLAPLGGPVDWTWMLGHIERNHLGGWTPNDGTTPPAALPPMPETELPYEHPSTFNQWWYEYPKTGNGGSFPREEYVQIFRDLALMFGNPNGYNPAPGAENLPAGISPTDPSVVGDHPGRECAVWIDPLDGPDKEAQKKLATECPKERCSHTTTLSNYFDDEFNPKGTFPVITVCDGSPQDSSLSPWANTWKPTNNDKPLELALAVDYNGNGVRDLDEPLIRAGHEPFDDFGADGLPSDKEPGYKLGVNEDPNGDDWDPQYNPTGKEGNYRWDAGEPFKDDGLDGVPNTKSSPYDFGEGNGKFDYAAGYRTFLERDSRTVIEQLPMGTHKQPLDDEAISRLDLWTDGGTRDLFNFAVDAAALAGAWSSRNRVTHYYTEAHNIPGQNPADVKNFTGSKLDFSSIPGGVLLRYGKIDPVQKDVDLGSGQHVGTVDEIARRLQSALYFIGSRWPDSPRTQDESSNIEPVAGATACEVNGACDWVFTDSRGRTGPVSVNLPPGYAHKDLQTKRYPVIFLLHGYGQTPEDLKAAIIFLSNWMNFPGDSTATRLPKAIMVYVDGRCRPGKDEAECIRGTFYADSVREKGPKIESWFLELMDEVDKKYRTQPASEIEWVE
ncbi:MAG: hypothetical protein IPI67_34745 [Myxococcales bacterium]|nr:hypothetical protein [Myxococcales bacterium]